MPLFWLSVTFLLGVWVGAQGALPAIYWYGTSGAALCLGAACLMFLPIRLARLASRLPAKSQTVLKRVGSPEAAAAFACLLAAAFGLGAGRMQGSRPVSSPVWVASYNDAPIPVWLTGMISAPPDTRDFYTLFTVSAEMLRPMDSLIHYPVEGLVLAKVDLEEGEFQYADQIVLKGLLQTPPVYELFSYRDTLERRGIYTMMEYPSAGRLGSGQGSQVRHWLEKLHAHAMETVYRLFPDPEASLLAGILLGVDSGMDADVQKAFRETGTGHIIAISGFNMAIIATLAALLFTRWLGRWPGTLAAGLAVCLYAVFVGASPPVIRAALMGIIVVLGKRLGLTGAVYNSLAVVGAAMAFQNPSVLWDVGFQLSFLATAGIVALGSPLGSWFKEQVSKRLPEPQASTIAGPVTEYLLLTLSAQLAVTPVLAYHFQRLSISSLLANPLVLPVQPLLMGVSGASLLGGMIWLPLGKALAPLTLLPAAYTIRVVEAIAAWPAGEILFGHVPGTIAFLMALAIFGLPAAWQRWSQVRTFLHPKRWAASPFLMAAAVLLTAWIWRLALSGPDGRLHITFLDVGTGEAVLIQTPHRHQVLVNGGPSTSELSDSLGRTLPPGRRGLDLLVVAGTQEQQIGALPAILERYPPDQVLWSGVTTASYAARQSRSTLVSLGTPITEAVPGQVFQLDEECTLTVLDAGRQGAVLLLEYQDFRLLLPIGLDPDTTASQKWTPVSVLLAPGSGKAALADPDWLAQLSPQLVVLSVDAGDSNGLPDPAALEAYRPYSLLPTDEVGWVRVVSDGTRLWVETEN